MRAIVKNASVNIDQIVGDGQIVDIPQWTPEELAAFREFERAMQEDVIPEIERVLRMRARRAQESRHWIMF